MLAFDGCAQSSGWKFTFTGELGACRSLGDSGAGAVGSGLLPCDKARLPVSISCNGTGTGFRRIGLLFADDGAVGGGEVVTAAIAGGSNIDDLSLS